MVGEGKVIISFRSRDTLGIRVGSKIEVLESLFHQFGDVHQLSEIKLTEEEFNTLMRIKSFASEAVKEDSVKIWKE